MPKVKVNDINIYYETHGKGFPLVMIMGFSGNLYWWDPSLIEKLARRFRVIIFDNRGSGRTDAPKFDYSMKMFADDTSGLMKALNIQSAHVLGSSMGGAIAQELAINYPERIEKLVLCSTNCGFSKSVLPSPQVLKFMTSGRMGLAADEEDLKRTFSLMFTEDFIRKNPSFLEQFSERMRNYPITPEGYRGQAIANAKFNTYSRLPSIKVPTLVIHGKKDIILPPENARILAERIPGAKLVIFENHPHAMLYQEIDEVIKVIIEFLT